jgi:protein SCO1
MARANRLRWLALAGVGLVLLAFGALVVRGVVAGLTPAESYVRSLPRAAGTPLPVLFAAPSFDLPESRGLRVTSQDLRGKVWIANFIFTQCTSVCPPMTARLSRFAGRFRAAAVRFISVSVDPEHDTPLVLRNYADQWPTEPRWLLLAPSRTELEDVARGFRVAVLKSSDVKDPIVHSRLLSLVDASGNVRAVYDADDELAWQRIEADAKELVGSSPDVAPTDQGTTQPSALARFGCNGCHERREIAPQLGGGAERSVMLATGEAVMFSDDYLHESILSPQKKMRAGYAPQMPSYQHLTPVQVDALVAAIRALPKPEDTSIPNGASGPAEDPICHMKVATVEPTLTLKHNSVEVHFCSAACLAAFVKLHPESKIVGAP